MRAQFAPVLALDDLAPSYNLTPHMSDRPRALIYLRDEDKEVATSVYGLTKPRTIEVIGPEKPPDPLDPFSAKLLSEFGARTEEIRDPPEALLKLHQWFVDFDVYEGEEWSPAQIEVKFWDYSHAPAPSVQWPKHWPDLGDATSRKRGEVYWVVLDGQELRELKAFMETQHERGAVEISGKKMSMAYRYGFPGEAIWRAAFEAARKNALTSWERGEDTSVLQPRTPLRTREH